MVSQARSSMSSLLNDKCLHRMFGLKLLLNLEAPYVGGGCIRSQVCKLAHMLDLGNLSNRSICSISQNIVSSPHFVGVV